MVSSSKPSAVPILGAVPLQNQTAFTLCKEPFWSRIRLLGRQPFRGIPGPMATGTPFTTGYIHAHSEHVQPSNVWSTVQFMRLPMFDFPRAADNWPTIH